MKIGKFKLLLFVIFFITSVNINISQADISIYNLEAIKIKYLDNKKLIIAEGKAKATDQYGQQIFADTIIYNKNKSTIKTSSNSIYKDNKGSILYADQFFYDLILKKIEAKNNVKFIDKQNNLFFFDDFNYYENSEKGYGKNVRGYLNDDSSIEAPLIEIDNLKGITIAKNNKSKNKLFDQFLSLFRKSENTYTSCNITKDPDKKISDDCPDWSISTTNTTHDTNKKMIYHKNAVVKIRNFPVLYTPYFSHPDPSVQRKSGLLTPNIKNFENLGRTIKTPYYWDIDDNSDLTFSPIFYFKENSIYLAEYRKQNKNSNLYIDTSYSKGYKNLNKTDSDGNSLNRTDGSRNHFYLGFSGKYNDLFFKNNDIDFNLQRISQKNYLRVNEINTQFVKQDDSYLKNSIIINSYEDSKRIRLEATAFESLQDDNPNTKYAYTIPSILFNNFFQKFYQNINLETLLNSNNFGGDNNQLSQSNVISTISEPLIIKSLGISNIFKTNTLNSNIYNANIIGQKENFNSDLFASFGIENSLPLIRIKNNTEEIITPKIFTKYTPGTMRDQKDSNKILSYNDLYAIDRLGSSINRETGSSLGYGINYDINKKNNDSEVYLKGEFGIGQILQNKKNNKMPSNSSLNRKSSDIVGNFNFYFNEAIKNESLSNINKSKIIKEKIKRNLLDVNDGMNLNYEFILSNDINKILKSNLIISYLNEKNYFKTNYYETHDIDNSQQIEFSYYRAFDNDLNIKLTALKNLETKSSQSNQIEINYESDCLKIGLNLSKRFYEGDDLKKDNNLTLFLILKPFGQPFAPDLTNLINQK